MPNGLSILMCPGGSLQPTCDIHLDWVAEVYPWTTEGHREAAEELQEHRAECHRSAERRSRDPVDT